MKVSEPGTRFLNLAEKWLNGTISREEEQEFADWYNKEQNEPLFIPGSFVTDEETHRRRILDYIQKRKENKQRILSLRRRKIYMVAAACAAILIIGIIWISVNHFKNAGTNGTDQIFAERGNLIEKKNSSGKTIKYFLPDSTLVQLKANSTILYSADYNRSNRTISLNGSAVFAVRHNAVLPFKVYSNHLKTTVLGTEFSVTNSGKDSLETVAVMNGRVSVVEQSEVKPLDNNHPEKGMAGYILNPNQEVIYDPASGQIQKSLMPSPVALYPYDENELIFTDTPLSTVFKRLQKIYGISIVFDSQSIKGYTLTANLSTGSFFDKLDKACLAVNMHYNEIDGHILITQAANN